MVEMVTLVKPCSDITLCWVAGQVKTLDSKPKYFLKDYNALRQKKSMSQKVFITQLMAVE